MACLSGTDIATLLDGACDLDDRSWKALIYNLLCEINASIVAGGGGVTPIAALLTQTTVTAGAATSAALAAQAGRRGGQLRNLSSTEAINVNLGGPAVAAAPGLGVVWPGGVYELPAFYTGTVNVIRSGAVDATVEVLAW